MGRTESDLFGIAHVKVEFISVLKIYTIPILGSFIDLSEVSKYKFWCALATNSTVCMKNLLVLIVQNAYFRQIFQELEWYIFSEPQ